MSVSADSYGLHPDRLYACTLSRFRSFMLYVAAKRGYFPVLFLLRDVFSICIVRSCLSIICRFWSLLFCAWRNVSFAFSLFVCFWSACTASILRSPHLPRSAGTGWERKKRHFGKIRFSKNISLPPFFPYAWRRRSFCRQDLYWWSTDEAAADFLFWKY